MRRGRKRKKEKEENGIDRRTCPADAVLLANGPELVEGGGPFDRRLVHALGAVDVVGAAVARDGAQLGGPGGRVVRAEGLDDVVLDQRAARPAVDGEVAVDAGAVPRAVVRDDARRARVPPLAGDEVVHAAPRHVVRAPVAVRVRHAAAAVRPERVVVPVVGARAGIRPLDQVERRGDGCASCCRDGESD